MIQFVGWLLALVISGIIGSWIAYHWQRRGWLFQQKFRRLADRHDAQLVVTRDIFRLVDKRLYASRLYLNRLVSGTREDISVERERYAAVVFEWSEQISGLVIIMQIRFDGATATDFDQYFLPAFSEMDRKLAKLRESIEDGVIDRDISKQIKSDLYLINGRARDFMRNLLSMINFTADVVEEKPRISHKNLDQLGYIYLLKSLFQPRRNF